MPHGLKLALRLALILVATIAALYVSARVYFPGGMPNFLGMIIMLLGVLAALISLVWWERERPTASLNARDPQN